MQVTTELRPMFSYSFIYIVILIIIIISIFISIKRFKRKEVIENIVIPNYKDLSIIKNKYLLKIQELATDVNTQKINNRIAYQNLSKIIRNFIYEATNIKVQNYTLEDISLIKMPILYELVSEYYNPEFSKASGGNISSSIEKTRMVIEKWK